MPKIIDNPYANVSWASVNYIQSVSHAHAVSQSSFDNMYLRGIRHFAISNYHPSRITYPVTDYFNNVPDDVISSPNAENYGCTNTSDHFISIGSMFESGDGAGTRWQILFDNCLANLQHFDGGGMIIAHPRWSHMNYKELIKYLDYDERVLGCEVLSGGDVNLPINDSRFIWDSILSTGRRCYGFNTPDWAATGTEQWEGRNILLANELSEKECLKCYRDGRTYMAYYGNHELLKFTEIIATDNAVTVATNNPATIRFITRPGVIAKTVSGTTATYNVLNSDIYVRIEADVEGESVWSQPIMYKTKDQISRVNLYKKFIVL